MPRLSNINNEPQSYQSLIDFYNEYKDQSFELINIQLSDWFAANMSAALGGILDLLINNGNTIRFDKLDNQISKILKKNNFLSNFGFMKIYDDYHTTIQYKKLKRHDGKYFSNYISTELICRNELPQMTDLVKEKITEAIYEIFVNAQIHSESEYIYTCGQFYPKNNTIEFTIVDTGIGFKNNINNKFQSNLDAVKAIKWATRDKNTTKDVPGGIGLALLIEFIEKNKGKLQIVSDNGFYEFEYGKESTSFFGGAFPGSVVNLQFKTDDSSSYYMGNEINMEDIF